MFPVTVWSAIVRLQALARGIICSNIDRSDDLTRPLNTVSWVPNGRVRALPGIRIFGVKFFYPVARDFTEM
jgi:hypothetical protein